MKPSTSLLRKLPPLCVAMTFLWSACIAVGQQPTQRSNGQVPQSTEPIQTAPIQSASTQFLVLKTGSVYSGQLEFGSGKYVIRRRNGSSVRFRQGEVDFVTHSLNDAYNRLYARVEPGDMIGHQRLATWCLKYLLVDAARQQVAVLKNLARASNSQSRMTRLLERQIEDLANPRSEQTTTVPSQVASQKAIQEREVRRLPNTGATMASRADLKETIDSFSRESLREFNRSIHLRIVNGCAAARCHGDSDNPMRIWRVDNRGGINSTGVQRNLHAITKYLDRQTPINSELLKYMSKPHGGTDEPAYEETSHHFQAIREWVLATALQSDAVLTDQDGSISQTSFQTPPLTSHPDDTRAKNPTALVGSPPAFPMTPGESIPAPVDLSKTEERFVPRDEFDPEIFNRKFGNQHFDKATNSSTTPDSVNPPFQPRKPKRRTQSLPPVDEDG